MKFDPFRLFAIIVVLAGTLPAAPLAFHLIDLGTLGGSSASANSVNATGATAGSRTDIYGNPHAYSSTTDLTPPGSAGAQASGINNAGQIVGTAYAGSSPFATIWSGTGITTLASASYGMAINASGDVTGQWNGHAFLETAGVMTDLGVLPGGTWTSGYAINASGNIAGYGNTGSGAFQAFTWSVKSGFTQLKTFGGANSYAFGINDAGKVTGSAQTLAGFMHAFLATNGSLTDIGTLGGTSSYGYGINNNGSVVGYSFTAAGDSHGFLYDNGQLYDLNALISASGWVITAAYGINNAGQIAGTGLFGGIEHAVLLDPQALSAFNLLSAPATTASVPEPASILLSTAGLAFLLHRAAKPRIK